MPDALPAMYNTLADWWPLLSPPEDYAEEAAYFHGLLSGHTGRPVRTVLELGCGGGHNAVHLKPHFALTLVDVSPGMLAVSQALNPECTHHLGDMRSLRLGQRFDAVFIHDAIDYMRSEADLRAALATAHAHLEPGGLLILAPDHTEESFMEHTTHGGSSDATRGVRYLEWTHDPDPDDQRYASDFVYLFHHPDGTTTSAQDHHECGLFAFDDWGAWLGESGFTPKHTADAWGRDIFLGTRD